MSEYRIHHGDCRIIAKELPPESSHAILCDPPYELGFMGSKWDRSGVAFDPETWKALAECLIPGGFGMAFASSRGWHRLACAIEDAGLDIHPTIFNYHTGEQIELNSMWGWSFGSGFPKATRVATDNEEMKAAFEGHRYGRQAMKPALEPIILFQKPYRGKPVDSITMTGAGALNIEGARIATNGEELQAGAGGLLSHIRDGKEFSRGRDGEESADRRYTEKGATTFAALPGARSEVVDLVGRWPANLVVSHRPCCRCVGTKSIKPLEGHRPNPVGKQSDGNIVFNSKPEGYQKTSYTGVDGTETVQAWECVEGCPVRRLDAQSGTLKSGIMKAGTSRMIGFNGKVDGGYCGSFPVEATPTDTYGDEGGASRFFFNVAHQLDEADPVYYCGKVARGERDAGLDGDKKPLLWSSGAQNPGSFQAEGTDRSARNPHPTLKPIDLCRWLATLLLPPPIYSPRRILIPFSGAGSEMIGAMAAGWEEIVGIDLDQDGIYIPISKARLKHWKKVFDRERYQEVLAASQGDLFAQCAGG